MPLGEFPKVTTVFFFMKWIQIPDMLMHLDRVRPSEYHSVMICLLLTTNYRLTLPTSLSQHWITPTPPKDPKDPNSKKYSTVQDGTAEFYVSF